MNALRIEKLTAKTIDVDVPSSKSILNRALLLAALTDGDTLLKCNGFGDDTDSLLNCLFELGIRIECTPQGLLVYGRKNFNEKATLNVGSAGTVARFLTAILAFHGGEYELRASEQMSRRPMGILPLLSSLGAKIEPLGESGHFPFLLSSDKIKADRAEIETDTSTQYASGLMLAAALGERPFRLELLGGRTAGSYLKMTASLIRAFGGDCTALPKQNGFLVTPISAPPKEFDVEPDVSGACYFYALSLLCNTVVRVKGVHSDTLQGDIKFLEILRGKGVRITETDDGIVADGRFVPFYNGFDEDIKDFSDQTLTLAVLAAFAESPSILRDISHIRTQECDRVNAILVNLNALGVRAFTNGNDIFIEPSPVRPCKIETFGDHRVAMAFSLVGLKVGGIEIDDPVCCQKTFPNFFEKVQTLTN